MNSSIKLLILSVLILFGACAGDSQQASEKAGSDQAEQQAQVAEFREQLDSLDKTVLTRIEQLEDSLQSVAADQREAVEREITYLREVREEITTRKDNLKIEHRDNWHFFRENMEKSLVEIESRLNRTQQQ